MSRSKAADLDVGRRVITTEAAGLAALAAGLDGEYVRAVELLDGVTGRVIVSGMGKSGHIARKIAATMASTGTPAQFVHPGEASHGDLGMIVAGDAVICISNSGDTHELGDLIAHAKRFAIPLIGIVSRANSLLGQAADVTLVLPNAAEACPMGLAPTTSTTLALALGDAIAIALLERKGFSEDQFQVLHPGGSIGKRLAKVGDIMHQGEEIPLVASGTGMRDALLEMSTKTFGCVGVTGPAGELIGIVTDGDLRRHIDGDLLAQKVDAVMTPRPKTIRPQALAAEALGQMNARQITSLFVIEDARPVGIVRLHDCLQVGVA